MASFPPSSPCAYIPVETDITIGTVPVKLIPSSVEDAGLLVYLPTQKIMIVGNLGAFLPDVGSFAEPNIPVDKWLSTLNTMKMKAPNYLILGRGMYIAGQSAVNEALTDQYDALNYLRAETLKEINLYTSLDDIVQNVVLPSELANSPYTRQFTSTIPSIIRAIYHEYLGWFDGNVTNLESLGTLEQAQRLVDFGGGEKQVLSYVKDCMTEHTREGALQALKMTSALRQVYPSEEADDIYIQSLKMLAWTTPSAHLRNYYLTEAKRVRPGP